MSLAATRANRRFATTLVVAASLMALATVVGCPNSQSANDVAATGSTKASPVVRLLVVDDASLATAIEREWRASGRGDLAITQALAADLVDAKRLAADIVIYPAALLGDLAERHLIAELPHSAIENVEFAHTDIFPLLRRRECIWGEKVYAVPFGSPHLMLMYHKDLLEKHNLKPPATWTEYQEVVAALKASIPSGETLLPTVEPLAEGWGAKLLLARAAAYARHPNQYSALFDYQTMEPLIASPPYERALEELVAAQQAAPGMEPLSVQACEQAILDGKTAMAIAWPTRQAAASETSDAVALGCVELPGAKQLYNAATVQWTDSAEASRVPLLGVSGRLGSITTSARHTRAAADALLWLAGKEKGPIIAAQSAACTLYRSSQVPQASRFISDRYDAAFAGEYGEALENANERRLSMEMPRIPGHAEYLAELDAAVRQAVAGQQTPADALAGASEKWGEITKRRGLEQQKSAYMRSLGLEP